MRRNKSQITCRKVFPIVDWKECAICKGEFIRERGYAESTGPFYGGRGAEKYIGSCCAGDINEAQQLFDRYRVDTMTQRPVAPVLPPTREIRDSK